MSISTDILDLPRTLIESPSVSTFLAEEEASICPLLSNTNGTSTPLTFSHPLTPCADNDSNASDNLVNSDAKAETSSSGSSSGLDLPDSAAATLFSKHAYQHLQNNNGTGIQDANGHGPNLNISKEAPTFVSWNWPLIRKCTFFVFMSSIFGMCAVVIAMMVNLPNTCNPKTAWYRGGVFYEIFPTHFQDLSQDNVGGLKGITNSADFFVSMGITAVRLNSVFPSLNYPEDYENTISITEISSILGNEDDMRHLVDALHARNISLILDIPINLHDRELENFKSSSETILQNEQRHLNSSEMIGLPKDNNNNNNLVTEALRYWSDFGVDGFFLKCYDRCNSFANIPTNLAEWKEILGRDRVLIVSEAFIDAIAESQQDYALSNIDLVQVHLNINNGTKHLEERIKKVLTGKLLPRDDGTWIQWTIADSDEYRSMRVPESTNITLAATLMQLMLPGTPNIYSGDQIALVSAHNQTSDTKSSHHLSVMNWINTMLHFSRHATVNRYPELSAYNYKNLKIIADMIQLREHSPAIYKNSICKMDKILTNTQIRRSHNDILIVERIFPRRNTIVSISNLSAKKVTMDMTSMYYSGVKMLLQGNQNDKVFFSKFEIGPFETIVVKLDK